MVQCNITIQHRFKVTWHGGWPQTSSTTDVCFYPIMAPGYSAPLSSHSDAHCSSHFTDFFVWVWIRLYCICSNDGPDNAEVSRVVETLVNSPGFGTRCMLGDPIPWVLRKTIAFMPNVALVLLFAHFIHANIKCRVSKCVLGIPCRDPAAGMKQAVMKERSDGWEVELSMCSRANQIRLNYTFWWASKL